MVIEFLTSIIEGGYLGQAVIASVIWITVSILLITQVPVDDRLYDAGFIVLGYFFHVAQVVASTHRAVVAQKYAKDCADELNLRP